MGDIVHISPKEHQFHYRKHTVHITYLPKEQKWRWSFRYTVPKKFSGKAATLQDAKKEAKEWIDQMIPSTQA